VVGWWRISSAGGSACALGVGAVQPWEESRLGALWIEGFLEEK
jgi:hypothetical protein